jgi:hypothetical protein
MLAIGTLTRLSDVDATLGLAFAATGVLSRGFLAGAAFVLRTPV